MSNFTIKEALDFIMENDVKFVRLSFCDLLGRQKNMAIMSDRIEEAFKKGVSFDASAITGFKDVTESDLVLVPDASTMAVLPWRPTQGRVVRFLCEIRNPDMTPYDGDTRNLLKRVEQKAEALDLSCKIGTECEFYLFQTDEKGAPTEQTHDEGGYLDVSPYDKGENIRREACIYLEEMGIKPLSSHHEQGPGQNEIDFKYSSPVSSADNFMTFKNAIRAIAQRSGLFVSFMPRPIADKSGNGLHINLSVFKGGKNLFQTFDETCQSFMAGILNRIREMTAFLNPTVNSYDRLGRDEAPIYISWSKQNRSQLIRLPNATDEEYKRMELRSPDPTVNPYLAISLIISAGLEGVKNSEKLMEEALGALWTVC
jgi:glutamine synthetase